MLGWLLAESASHLWHPAEIENVANPDFENIKHLQNTGHLPLNEPGINRPKTCQQKKEKTNSHR